MLFAYFEFTRFILLAVGFLIHASDRVYGDQISSKISLDTNEEGIDDALMEVKSVANQFAGKTNGETDDECQLCSKCGLDEVITDLELVDNDGELEDSIKIEKMQKLISFCGKLAENCPECKHSWL